MMSSILVFCFQIFFWPTLKKKMFLWLRTFLKFEAESWEFANILRSLEQFIQTVKGQYKIWDRMLFKLVPGGFSDLIQ